MGDSIVGVLQSTNPPQDSLYPPAGSVLLFELFLERGDPSKRYLRVSANGNVLHLGDFRCPYKGLCRMSAFLAKGHEGKFVCSPQEFSIMCASQGR